MFVLPLDISLIEIWHMKYNLNKMANNEDLKKIAKSRFKTVKVLLEAEDWEGMAYMMGYVLECALKATVCRKLNLISYPETAKNKKIPEYFMTHRFDQLLVVSGMSGIFSDRGPDEAYLHWSDFSLEYAGDWPSMRYDPDRQWEEKKVKSLYTNLKGIIKEIIKVW